MCSLKIYKPFSLAWHCHPSRKGCFYNQSRNMTGTHIYILCCKMNVTCSDSAVGESCRSHSYFQKWSKTTISGSQKAEWVTGRGYLLAKLIKGNAGLNGLLPVKDRWRQDSTSRLQQAGGGSHQKSGPRAASSHALWLPSLVWSGWGHCLLLTGTSRHGNECPGRWLRLVAMHQSSGYLVALASRCIGFPGVLSATHVALTRLD